MVPAELEALQMQAARLIGRTRQRHWNTVVLGRPVRRRQVASMRGHAAHL